MAERRQMPPIRRPVLSMALNAWVAFVAGAALAEAPPNLQVGAVTPFVECPSAPAQSFALYLPCSHRPDAKWPILCVVPPPHRRRCRERRTGPNIPVWRATVSTSR